MNFSIQTGIFPDKLKIASVAPIFKGGENWNLGNYIPTSRPNKLSLNIKKTKHTLFHKKSAKTEMSGVKIESKNSEKTSSIKFLGVMLDEHVSWNDHIKTVESKLAKNIGL